MFRTLNAKRKTAKSASKEKKKIFFKKSRKKKNAEKVKDRKVQRKCLIKYRVSTDKNK